MGSALVQDECHESDAAMDKPVLQSEYLEEAESEVLRQAGRMAVGIERGKVD
jgi:hypothetical protein